MQTPAHVATVAAAPPFSLHTLCVTLCLPSWLTRQSCCTLQGLLFHAREYPALDNDTAAASYFPYNLGYCQAGTPLAFDGAAMDHRNILYFQVSHCCVQATVYECQ